MKRTLGLLAALAAATFAIPSAHARNPYNDAFMDNYGTTGTALDTCTLCHGATKTVRNPYGQDVEAGIVGAGMAPVDAFLAIEDIDSDGDGYTNVVEIQALTLPGDPTSYPVGPTCTDADGDGFFTDAACGVVDCNDSDPAVNPAAAEETCDGVDNDCDPATLDEWDNDGDGESVCTDCDDNAGWNFHGNVEMCGDGRDNDCDGTIDLADVDCQPTCTDADGDGYYAEAGCGTAVDCNDADASINPGVVELECDLIDNNCNGMVDDDPGIDVDGDGATTCTDCDDNDAFNFPGNTEICDDGFDNNCDTLVDADDPQCAPPPVCADYATKGDCNLYPECVWVGSPRSGHCEDVPVCNVTESPETSCGDGVDNDCDGAVDCDDSDCDCPPADCSAYGDKTSCAADAQCRWSPKDKACVAA